MRKSTTRRKIILGVGIFAVVGLFVCVIWFAGNRLGNLERRLTASEEQAAAIRENLREYSHELELALERAENARRRAADAEEDANEAVAARLEAELNKERSEYAVQQARAETGQTREELGRIKRNREEELDRMQQALNKIAPTTRTPSGMVMMLSNDTLQFDFDKAVIKPQNKETLSRIAGILLASEGYRLFVDGHTDDIGTDEYNMGLSERRAQAVCDYLVAAGIPDEMISIQGFGKSEPLSNEKSSAARARNRRVEIGIVDTIIHYQGNTRD